MCKTPTLKKTKNGFQDQLSLNVGQKYCRMLQMEHSAILSTFIKLPVVIKLFCLFLSGCFTQVLLYIRRVNLLPVLEQTLSRVYHILYWYPQTVSSGCLGLMSCYLALSRYNIMAMKSQLDQPTM